MQNLSQNKKDALKFLEHARIDIAVTKLLYRSGIYSQSTYHLQQAVEKATKACLMAISKISAKELKDYSSHDVAKAFELLINNQQTMQLVRWHASQHPETEKHLQDFKKIVSADKARYVLMSKEDILAEAKKTFNITVPYSDEPQPILDQALKNLGITVANKNEKIALLKGILNIGLTQQAVSLFLFSLIMEPHSNLPRYPNQMIPVEEYTKELGIVDAAPEIIAMIEPAIEKIRTHINTMQH